MEIQSTIICMFLGGKGEAASTTSSNVPILVMGSYLIQTCEVDLSCNNAIMSAITCANTKRIYSAW